MEHFREEAEKSTVTFEKQDCKNEASEVKHTIIPDFLAKNPKNQLSVPKSQPCLTPGPPMVNSEETTTASRCDFPIKLPNSARRASFEELRYFGGNLKFKFKIETKHLIL